MGLFEHKDVRLRNKNPVPDTFNAWLAEIVRAYCDALETIPFGEFVDAELDEGNVFHLAPAICLKFRGVRRTKKILQQTTEAALSSYVASCEDGDKEALKDPRMAFTLCYVASHFALDLIAEEDATQVLEFIERHKKKFQCLVDEHVKAFDAAWNNTENRKAFYQKSCEWEKRQWKKWLEENLTFPFKVRREDDENGPCFADIGRRELFRLGHTFEVLGISYEDDLRGIIVKAREGRATGSVPLCDVQVISRCNPNFWPVKEYAVWFANR